MKKKRTLFIIIILSTVLMANKCYLKEDINNRITIDNKTSKYLYCVPCFSYPDTSLNFTNKDIIIANKGIYEITPNTIGKMGSISLCEESEWKRVVPFGTLMVFVFLKSDIDNNDWNTIVSNNMVYKKYKLTYQDLVRNTCTLLVN
jgi:hypothetical protein